MPTPIYVYRELEGACYDALKMIHDNNTVGAYNILAKKLLRIKRYEHENSFKIIWNSEDEHHAMQEVSTDLGDSKEEESECAPGIMSILPRDS